METNEILDLINQFKSNNIEELEYQYTNGDCYVFAQALAEKFQGTICYLPIQNHFICLIDNMFYDITGIVSVERDEPVYTW